MTYAWFAFQVEIGQDDNRREIATSGESVLGREKNKLPQTIHVASVGPALCVKGGITRVIELIGAHLPGHICVRFIATFNRYTGDKGATRAERGSRLAQALVFLLAFVQTLIHALARGTIFHVHFSGRGSLLRKGVICVMLRSLRCQYLVHSHAADTNLFSPMATDGLQAADLMGYLWRGTSDRPHPILARLLLLHPEFAGRTRSTTSQPG